jgi:hypothetical protein
LNRSRWLDFLADSYPLLLIGKARVILPNLPLLWKINRAAEDLEESQESILISIIKAQQSTEYGLKHHFRHIDSVESYRRNVPVNDYEDLRPWIEKQDKGGMHAISASTPVYYAVTSGTTGEPKYIPVPRKTMKVHQQVQNLGIYHLIKTIPEVSRGRVLAIVSPAVEGCMDGSGLPFGSTSGRMYDEIPHIIKSLKYVLPSEVFSIEEYSLKYITILRLALQHNNISYVTTANPSTLCLLAKYLNEHLDVLIGDIEKGDFHAINHLSSSQSKSIRPYLNADPERARELRTVQRSAGAQRVRLQDVWPNLKCVACWTGGNCSIFIEQLKSHLSPDTLIWDIGYLSSEIRATAPMRGGGAAGLPIFWNSYFEFVKREEWGENEPSFLGLHELENGRQYYIFVTTDSGLYRYNMHDIVEVDGFYKGVPLLKFVQKGKGITSITGEKLFESQIISAVEKTDKKLNICSSFYTMAADEHLSRYQLYYEPDRNCESKMLEQLTDIALEVDKALQDINCEYCAKRKSGRIKPLQVSVLKQNSYEEFKRCYVTLGQREGQFKIIALLYKKDLKFDFSPYIISESDPNSQQRAIRESF